MSKLSVSIPNSLREQLGEAAERDGISMSEFVAFAAAEKIASRDAMRYLEERAKRGSREKLLRVLEKAPNAEPDECDRIE